MHKTVLLAPVLELIRPQLGGLFLDATFGGGGFTKRILGFFFLFFIFIFIFQKKKKSQIDSINRVPKYKSCSIRS